MSVRVRKHREGDFERGERSRSGPPCPPAQGRKWTGTQKVPLRARHPWRPRHTHCTQSRPIHRRGAHPVELLEFGFERRGSERECVLLLEEDPLLREVGPDDGDGQRQDDEGDHHRERRHRLSRGGDGHNVAVPNRHEGDDAPPEGLRDGVEGVRLVPDHLVRGAILGEVDEGGEEDGGEREHEEHHHEHVRGVPDGVEDDLELVDAPAELEDAEDAEEADHANDARAAEVRVAHDVLQGQFYEEREDREEVDLGGGTEE